MIDRPAVKVTDGVYEVTFPSLEVAMTADRFYDHSQGITAEMTIYGKRPPLTGDLLRTRFNLLSGSTKRRTAKDLFEGYAGLDAKVWDEFIELGCNALVDKFRSLEESGDTVGEAGLRINWEDPATDWQDVAERDWILPGILTTSSMTVVSGPPKEGKSFWLMALLKASSNGEKFMGYPIRKLFTWYFSEAPPVDLRGQMEQLDFQWQPGQSRFAVLERQAKKLTPAQLGELINEDYADSLGHPHQPGLIVIDTMTPWLDNDDWNDPSKTERALAPIRSGTVAFRENGGTVIIVHHAKKGYTGRTADTLRGSGAVPAFFDNIITITMVNPDDVDGPRRIETIGRPGHSHAETVWSGADGFTLTESKQEIYESILEAVDDGNEQNKTILEALGWPEKDRNKLTKLLNDLLKRGQLVRTGKGTAARYHFPIPEQDSVAD